MVLQLNLHWVSFEEKRMVPGQRNSEKLQGKDKQVGSLPGAKLVGDILSFTMVETTGEGKDLCNAS